MEWALVSGLAIFLGGLGLVLRQIAAHNDNAHNDKQ